MRWRAAITTAPLPTTVGLVEATFACVGSNEDADQGHPGAQKMTRRQSDTQEKGIDVATITMTPPPASGIHAPQLEAACGPRGSSVGPVDTGEHPHLVLFIALP